MKQKICSICNGHRYLTPFRIKIHPFGDRRILNNLTICPNCKGTGYDKKENRNEM